MKLRWGGYIINLDLLMIAGLVTAFLLVSIISVVRPYWLEIETISRMSRRRLAFVLSGFSTGLFVYIAWFGNQSFAGFDCSPLIDFGWRLVRNQMPFVDFNCTFPPAFILGVKYAFDLWGISWDAQLYMNGLFAVLSFLWLYGLLRVFIESEVVSIFVALTLECMSLLVPAFWWYNHISSVAASIYLLSCLFLFRRPTLFLSQASFAVSLFLLSLMKPNIAAPLIVGTLCLLILNSAVRKMVLLLTAVSGLAVYCFLTANNIPLPLLLKSYADAAQARGITSLYGLRLTTPWFLTITSSFLVLMLLPLCAASYQRFKRVWEEKNFAEVPFWLILALGPVVGIIAMLTNGDSKFVDMLLFVVAGSVVVYGKPELLGVRLPQRLSYQSMFLALLLSMCVINLYTGVARYRVYTAGAFFDHHAKERNNTAFFHNLRSGPRFVKVINEIEDVLQHQPTKPVFFGPRMEFAYATFGIDSPKYLPVWWDPGTSFSIAQEPEILKRWKDRRFATLIFLKDDYTYYGDDFMKVLEAGYTKDESYPELTVMRLK